MMSTFYSDIQFSMQSNTFQHNLKHDFACFALWDKARPFLKDIRAYLQDNFEILLETEIVWSEEHFHDNASRLYEVPIYKNVEKLNRHSSHAKKIGGRSFIVFIVRDAKPEYTYAMSVSKKIELSNLNIVKAKYTFRDWIEEKSGTKYGVHSTNNIHEFFFQAPLLLGVELFRKLLKGEQVTLPRLEKDLEGATGWNNYTELFDLLNATSNYLVLRSYETLPAMNEDKDIDLLTDNFQRFASIVGAAQRLNKSYKGEIKVGGEAISLDIRFVGDRYYDSSWQQDMLATKVNKNGILVPRDDHYFFSLLHHAKVQKETVKKKYYQILDALATKLQFSWFSSEMLDDDATSASLLKGFYQANHYFYDAPIDEQVYENKTISRVLPSTNSIVPSETAKGKVKRLLVTYFPESVFLWVKKIKSKL